MIDTYNHRNSSLDQWRLDQRPDGDEKNTIPNCKRRAISIMVPSGATRDTKQIEFLIL